MNTEDFMEVHPGIVVDTHCCAMEGHRRYDKVVAWEEGQEQYCFDDNGPEVFCGTYFNAEILEYLRIGWRMCGTRRSTEYLTTLSVRRPLMATGTLL